LQPQSTTKDQIEEDPEAAADDQMTQVDPLHLCFQPSEAFKQEEEEQPAQINLVPNKPVCNKLQVSFHVLYDALADKLNDERNLCSSPLESYEVQYQVVDSLSSPKHDSDPKPLYRSLFQPCNNVHMLQDPFVQYLYSTKKVSSFLIFSMVNKATSDGKISVPSITKHRQQNSLMVIMLKWLHWLFHFT